jgi:CheY-like chemotaxis protein
VKILLVEDNAISSRMLEIYLRRNGYDTALAKTGKEALQCLQSIPGIGLVVTDIRMPDLDGLRLLQLMKESPEWRGIPVIMSTVVADRETVREAVKRGCRGYLLKPVKEAQILQTLREVLGDERKVLRDRNEVTRVLGIDSKSYDEIVCTFTGQLCEKLEWLEKQLKEGAELPPGGDLQDLTEGASLLGAERVAHLLDGLALDKVGKDSDKMRAELFLLLKELKTLRETLSPRGATGEMEENQDSVGNPADIEGHSESV